MKIKQTKTAIDCYHSLNDQHFTNEEQKTLQYLTAPKTISMLCRLTCIEKSSMSRVLNSLHHKKQQINVVKIDKCPVTHKTVQWYVSNENQLKLF